MATFHISRRVLATLMSLLLYTNRSAEATSPANIVTFDESGPFAIDEELVTGSLIIGYSSAVGLENIKTHVGKVKGQGKKVEVKGVHTFKNPQKVKPNQDRGQGSDNANRERKRQHIFQRLLNAHDAEKASLGFVVVKSEDGDVGALGTELGALDGVTQVEADTISHIVSDENYYSIGLRGHGSAQEQIKGIMDTMEREKAGLPSFPEVDGRRRKLQEAKMWGIDMINVTNLWNLQAPATPIKICVVDTGYDLGHPDLPINVTGWNDPSGSYGVWNIDGLGHGTHVAGSIGAIGGNSRKSYLPSYFLAFISCANHSHDNGIPSISIYMHFIQRVLWESIPTHLGFNSSLPKASVMAEVLQHQTLLMLSSLALMLAPKLSLCPWDVQIVMGYPTISSIKILTIRIFLSFLLPEIQGNLMPIILLLTKV